MARTAVMTASGPVMSVETITDDVDDDNDDDDVVDDEVCWRCRLFRELADTNTMHEGHVELKILSITPL